MDLDSEDRDVRQTYLWSVLFATGYLTDAAEPENGIPKLVIPNREVQGIYEKSVKKEMKENLPTGKASTKSSEKQNSSACFYHGMLLGLLQVEGSWRIRSNAESRIGYTDIRLEIPSVKTGCVIEVKYAENGKYDQACAKAMQQIEDDGYAEALKQDGMQIIHKYGIACYKKSCKISYRLER